MSESNPDEVGHVPDAPEWTAQPRGDAWGVPHGHSSDQGRFDQYSPASGGLPQNQPSTHEPPPAQPSPNGAQPTQFHPSHFHPTQAHPSQQAFSQSQPAQPGPGQPLWNQYGQGQNGPGQNGPGQNGPGQNSQGQNGAGTYPQYPAQPHPGGYPPQFPQAPPGAVWTAPLRTDYAHWGRRVGAYFIDFAPSYVGLGFFFVWYFQFVFAMLGAAQTQTLPTDIVSPVLIIGVVIILLGYPYIIWNRYFLDGRRGQTLGKRALKIRLISEATGEPIGALNAFLRDLVHTVDSASYVGYLWPLWDDKRQTFSDKLMKTIVVDAPRTADHPTGRHPQSTYVG